jgi:hypothetical protein
MRTYNEKMTIFYWNTLNYLHKEWGGLVVKELNFILGV